MEEETFPLRASEGGFYMKVTSGIIEAAKNLKLQWRYTFSPLNKKKEKRPMAVAVSVFSVEFSHINVRVLGPKKKKRCLCHGWKPPAAQRWQNRCVGRKLMSPPGHNFQWGGSWFQMTVQDVKPLIHSRDICSTSPLCLLQRTGSEFVLGSVAGMLKYGTKQMLMMFHRSEVTIWRQSTLLSGVYQLP